MLAQREPRPERRATYLTKSIVRLYVTARNSETFDQYIGLEDNSPIEMLGRALFAANRQGRAQRPTPIGTKVRPPKDARDRVTEHILGVELTLTRQSMDLLKALAAHYPRPVNGPRISRMTGQPVPVIRQRIMDLRATLRLGDRLDIPHQTNNAGWRLALTEPSL